MEKIIPSSPARYPLTNVPERKAIDVLRYILSDYVKPNIREMDKVPNTDGYLDIINDLHEPIGKIEVQVKGVSEGFLGEPKYQCSLNFLAYCEICISPVFLILVDIKNEVAYWLLVSREILKELASKIKKDSESISVKIPSKNIIRRESSEYLQEWKKIIEDYSKKIRYYDTLLEEHTDLEKAYEMLMKENGLLGVEKPEFHNIHKFLDCFNMYLDTDFTIIKNIYYKDCWKLGIGYNHYSEKDITYLLYPIKFNKNDLQIREISDKLKDELRKELGTCSVRSIIPKNPIHTQPERYAKELILEKVEDICKNKLLPISHLSLFREVIFKFIDKLHDCLNLKRKDSYTVEEIKYSFYTYLPIWVDEVLTIENINLGYHPVHSPYIDPEHLLAQLSQTKREEINNKVKERIQNEQTNYKNVRLGNRRLPLKLISNFLESSPLKDSEEINRFYIPPNFDRSASNSYIWSFYSPAEVLENVMRFFNEFHKIYDATVDQCFPKLKREINFFNNFDTLIVVIEAHDKYLNFGKGPSIECYYLKRKDANPKNEIKFYMKNSDNIPINREMDFKSEIYIDGKPYTVKSDSCGSLNFIFKDLPMLSYLYEILREKVDDFSYNDE